MNKYTLSLLTVSLLLIAACGGGDQKAADAKAHDQAIQVSGSEQITNHDRAMTKVANQAHAMIKLPTIQCEICKAAIEAGLIKTAGILSVIVDLGGKMAHVNYDGDQLSLEDVERAIADLGYQANDRPADLVAYANLPDCCKVTQ